MAKNPVPIRDPGPPSKSQPIKPGGKPGGSGNKPGGPAPGKGK